MSSSRARRKGMSYRLSANAAMEASSRDSRTVGMLTSRLLIRACCWPPSTQACRKPPRVKECGMLPRPCEAMSSKDRVAVIRTTAIGTSHRTDTSPAPVWKATVPHRGRAGLGDRRAAGGASWPAAVSGVVPVTLISRPP
ncbi:hypothetical protein [Actinacidiphila paucisporea]|nr:hypothetical protein [Actinacidiphila paucisporea]